MSERPNFEAVRQRALAVLPSLVRDWLREGRQTGGVWAAKNPMRVDRKAGSFVVWTRTGAWKDYAVPGVSGGDPISLYAYLNDLGQGEACSELAGLLGMDDGVRRDPTRERKPAPVAAPSEAEIRDVEDAAVARRRKAAGFIWGKAGPAAGTVVETYLRGRGITIPVPPTLRFGMTDHPVDRGRPRPAMIAKMQVDAIFTGVHRTYLDPDGEGKARIPDPNGRRGELANTKLMLGTADGAVVRLSALSPCLVLAEGIESALSVLQVAPSWTVWAALSAGNLAKVAIPPEVRRLVIVADADKSPDFREPSGNRRVGLAMAEKAIAALRGLGVEGWIVEPPERTDANDCLLRDPEWMAQLAGWLEGLAAPFKVGEAA